MCQRALKYNMTEIQRFNEQPLHFTDTQIHTQELVLRCY